MDRNTMIVKVVEALLWFAAVIIVVLRLNRLWLKLRELRLRVGQMVEISARFFQGEQRPYALSDAATMIRLISGDVTVDQFIITHPDDDHRILKIPHHGSRSR
jgi:hypothetical protein